MHWCRYICEDCGREVVEIENDEGITVSECDCVHANIYDLDDDWESYVPYA